MKIHIKEIFLTFLLFLTGILFGFLNVPVREVQAQSDEAAIPQKSGLVFVVPIKEEVDYGMYAAVNRLLDAAEKEGAALVIFEIDTPGGRADICFDICERIMQVKAETAAYVVTEATSAGSIIALACSRIYMKPATTIGSAAPVLMTPGGAQSPPDEDYKEKLLSYLRSRIKAIAETNNYPPSLAMAMVDRQIEVFEVIVNGTRQFLTTEELEALDELQSDIEIKHTVSASGKLLNLTAMDAEKYGLSSGTIKDRQEVMGHYDLSNAAITVGKITWSEKLVRLLTNPMVKFILFVLGAIGIYVELKVPGFGVPGILGIVCFILLFWGHYLAGLAEWGEIALVMAGFILLTVEIFVIPGFGIAGIGGLLCIFLGLILSFQNFTIPSPQTPWELDLFMGNLVGLMFSFTVIIVMILTLARFMPGIPILNRMVHMGREAASAGYQVQSQASLDLKGKTGVTATTLRPAGKATIDNRIVTVVTHGDFLEQDVTIRVVEVSGNRIVVEKEEGENV